MAICLQCNKKFEPYRNSKGKFCSYKCNGLYGGVIRRKKATVIKVCGCCDKEFKIMKGKIRKGEGKYCSYSCSAKMTKNFTGMKHGDETKSIMSKARLGKYEGDKHPNYKNGEKSGRGSGSSKFRQWKESVLKICRDECAHCGAKDRLDTHHILSWKEHPNERHEVKNGLMLCKSCHTKEHHRLRKEELCVL